MRVPIGRGTLVVSTFLILVMTFLSPPALADGPPNATPISACGTISSSGSYYLTASVTSPGTCFFIRATGVTLNCVGLTITYATLTGGVGIVIASSGGSQLTQVNVVNCVITAGGTVSYHQHGIDLVNTAFSGVRNNQIVTDGISLNFGVALYQSSHDNDISDNYVRTNGSAGDNHGIVLSDSGSNTILRNNISTYNRAIASSSNNVGVYLAGQANSNQLDNNWIVTNGSGNSNSGIRADPGSAAVGPSGTIVRWNNVSTGASAIAGVHQHGVDLVIASYSEVRNNTIKTNGGSNNYGVALYQGSHDNEIDNNSVFTDGDAGYNHGVVLSDSGPNTIVRNNISTHNRGTASDSNNVGVYLAGQANSNRLDSNWIVTNGSGNSNSGIRADPGSASLGPSATIMRWNNVSTGSWAGGYFQTGIQLIKSSSSSVLNNTVRTNGIGSSATNTSNNHGISLYQGSTDNDINDNMIRADGELGSSIGISLSDSGANSILRNNISTTNRVWKPSIGEASYNRGIVLAGVANSNVVDGNRVNTNGSASANTGIDLESAGGSAGPSGNSITRNNVTTGGVPRLTGSQGSWGVRLAGNPALGTLTQLNSIENNTINASANLGQNYGVGLEGGANQNKITNNTIISYGTWQPHGVVLAAQSHGNNVSRNNITAMASANNSYVGGVVISAWSNQSLVDSNTIIVRAPYQAIGVFMNEANGTRVTRNLVHTTATDHRAIGIYLDYSTTYSAVATNNLTSISYGSRALGIVVLYGAVFNTFTGNSVVTFGSSGSSDGIRLECADNNTFSGGQVVTNDPSSHAIRLLSSSGNSFTGLQLRVSHTSSAEWRSEIRGDLRACAIRSLQSLSNSGDSLIFLRTSSTVDVVDTINSTQSISDATELKGVLPGEMAPVGSAPAGWASLSKQFRISNPLLNSTLALEIHYTDAEWQSAGILESSLSVWQYLGANLWTNLGFHDGTNSVDPIANLVATHIVVFGFGPMLYDVMGCTGIPCI